MNNQFCFCQSDDAPKLLPPSTPPSLPSSFSTPISIVEMKSWMCNCLGRWGYLRLHRSGSFGRDLWFFPAEVRQRDVSGYTWQDGQRFKVTYRYKQISNFMCFA
ncbi:TPA: hypothetical protein QCW96_005398 [Bacillus pacificus]|nr:hypothetical protein BA202_12680 [Bacillus cereus]MBG0962213.1 hypothetical protein [Bacillus sp. SRB1LM]HDR7255986.1 hypothetical protein [Bacillus pacificus]HDR7488773.1 hypothetical protein [Bacillus pacificus]